MKGEGASFYEISLIIYQLDIFYVHETVHLDKFLIIEPTGFTNFSNLFLE